MTIGASLRAYCADEERDFFFNLRANLTWDVQMFEQLASAMEETLEEMTGEEQIPRWVIGFYSWQVEAIAGLARRNDIVVVSGGGEIEGSTVVPRAVERLKRYQLWLCEDRDPNAVD